MNPVPVRVLIPRGRPRRSLNERRGVDVLDKSDPICQLSDQIHHTLDGYDGGTVLAALAMTLTTTIMWTEHKSGLPLPTELLMLREDLTDLIVRIVRARGAQRES